GSSSAQEELPGRRIAAVNLLMADRAGTPDDLVGVRRVVEEEPFVDRRRMPRGHVAPLAEERPLGDEEPLVVAAVRVVARDAGVGDRRVFPQERSAFLRVAAGAALVNRGADLQEPDVLRAVRVVARPAGELGLADGHVMRPELLVDDGLVAGRAQLHLGRRLQLVIALRIVDAVTGDTANIPLIMLAAGPERVRASVVARHAVRARFLRPHRLEIDDQRGITSAVDVRLSRTMAAPASHVGGGGSLVRLQTVRGARVLLVVAGDARAFADVLIARRRSGCLGRG